jgi:hypothetical protein
VEVVGRWSNLSEQGERLQTLVEMAPSGVIQPNSPKIRTAKQVHKRLLSAQVDQLVSDYRGGAKLTDLVAKFGVSRGTVSKLLESRGIPRRYRKLSTDDIHKMVDLYRTGQSLAKVGAQLDVDPNTVRHHLLRAGVAMRDSHGRQR